MWKFTFGYILLLATIFSFCGTITEPIKKFASDDQGN